MDCTTSGLLSCSGFSCPCLVLDSAHGEVSVSVLIRCHMHTTMYTLIHTQICYTHTLHTYTHTHTQYAHTHTHTRPTQHAHKHTHTCAYTTTLHVHTHTYMCTQSVENVWDQANSEHCINNGLILWLVGNYSLILSAIEHKEKKFTMSWIGIPAAFLQCKNVDLRKAVSSLGNGFLLNVQFILIT